MIPSTATWLEAMIKAMAQVVIPALDGNDVVAIEQARLVLQHLRLLRLQHPYILHYQQQQASDAQALLAALVSMMRESGATSEAMRDADALLLECDRLCSMPLPALAELEAATVALKAVANRISEDLIKNEPSALPRVNVQVLQWAEPTVLRERAWLSTADDNNSIPTLDSLF
jgi:hypothetical protein